MSACPYTHCPHESTCDHMGKCIYPGQEERTLEQDLDALLVRLEKDEKTLHNVFGDTETAANISDAIGAIRFLRSHIKK